MLELECLLREFGLILLFGAIVKCVGGVLSMTVDVSSSKIKSAKNDDAVFTDFTFTIEAILCDVIGACDANFISSSNDNLCIRGNVGIVGLR